MNPIEFDAIAPTKLNIVPSYPTVTAKATIAAYNMNVSV
jgi:hypothetical protein